MKIARLSLKADVVLTLAARLAPGILSLLAVPFYIRVLGPERYAAVGFLITIQMVVGLLDSGLSAAVGREAAWLSPRAEQAGRLRSLLLTSERVFLGMALLILGVGIVAGHSIQTSLFGGELEAVGAGYLTTVLMFATIAARFPFAIYFGYLGGSGHLGSANGVVLACDTLRTAGCVVILAIAGPSLAAFFAWQLLMSIATTVAGAILSRQVTRPSQEPLDWSALRGLGHFAAGSGSMSILFVFANSIDRIALPKFISAADFGAYVALSQIASIVFIVAHSFWAALNPRLLAALSVEDQQGSSRLFSLQSTFMTAAAIGAVIITGLSGDVIADLWLGPVADGDSHLILFILTTGYASAALSHMALTQQQAKKSMKTAAIALAFALFAVPATALGLLGQLSATTGAFTWACLYGVFLLGSGVVFLSEGRPYLRPWALRAVGPFFFAVLFAAILGPVVDQWTAPERLFAGCGTSLLSTILILMQSAPLRASAAALISRFAPVRSQK